MPDHIPSSRGEYLETLPSFAAATGTMARMPELSRSISTMGARMSTRTLASADPGHTISPLVPQGIVAEHSSSPGRYSPSHSVGKSTEESHSSNPLSAGAPSSRFPAQSGVSDFEKLTSLAHLYWCWQQVKKSKSRKTRVRRFDQNALQYLLEIQRRLRDETFVFGPYHYFQVIEKKRRDVVDSPMKDRVVHWMLYEYLTKIWQKRFIPDSFGNIRGRGTLKAVQRVAEFARKPENTYALLMDISKFFYSVPHEYLKIAVLRHVGDQKMRNLIGKLIDSFVTDSRYDHLFPEDGIYRKTQKKGMPLGNLTSQLFCNILLNDFDHWVKETLRLRHYLRYVDDICILGNASAELWTIANILMAKLGAIGLTVHPNKQSISPVSAGIPYLGFIIWPNHISAGKYIRREYHRALRRSAFVENNEQIQSYRAWLKHTGTSF